MDFTDEFAILKEMQEDLKEHFEREYEGEAQLGNSEAEEKRKFFILYRKPLQEHLLDQLNWLIVPRVLGKHPNTSSAVLMRMDFYREIFLTWLWFPD